MAAQWFLNSIEVAKKHDLCDVLKTYEEAQGKMLIAAIKSSNTDCIAGLLESGADINYVEHVDDNDQENHVFSYLLHRARCISIPMSMFVTVDDILSNVALNTGECVWCETLAGKTGDKSDIAKIFCHFIQQAETPLAQAVIDDQLSSVVTPQDVTIVCMLLANGANMSTDCGWWVGLIHVTVAECVVWLNKVPLMELFLKHGFDVNNISTNIVATAERKMLLTLIHAGLHHNLLAKSSLCLAQVAGASGHNVPNDVQDPEPVSLLFACCTQIRQWLTQKYKENIVFCVINHCKFLPAIVQKYLLCGEDV